MRCGNRHPSVTPYETFETADRRSRAAATTRMFARLCEVRRRLPLEERFATNQARVAHARRVGVRASRRDCASTRRSSWLSPRLRAAKVPAGPINGIDEAFALAEQLGMEPSEDGLINPPLRIDGERPPIRHRPPHLDEHGDDLRRWLEL